MVETQHSVLGLLFHLIDPSWFNVGVKHKMLIIVRSSFPWYSLGNHFFLAFSIISSVNNLKNLTAFIIFVLLIDLVALIALLEAWSNWKINQLLACRSPVSFQMTLNPLPCSQMGSILRYSSLKEKGKKVIQNFHALYDYGIFFSVK